MLAIFSKSPCLFSSTRRKFSKYLPSTTDRLLLVERKDSGEEKSKFWRRGIHTKMGQELRQKSQENKTQKGPGLVVLGTGWAGFNILSALIF